jgi:hypothetical protein
VLHIDGLIAVSNITTAAWRVIQNGNSPEGS